MTSHLFLKAVELPEYCFLSEAVEWIALGRVPEAYFDVEESADQPAESRFHWNGMPENFQPPEDYPWHDRAEFEALGIEFREDYPDAAEKCFLEAVSDLPGRILEYEAKPPSLIQDHEGRQYDLWKQLAKDAADTLERLSAERMLVEEVEAEFNRFLEVGWSQVFQWVQLGQVEIEALDYCRWEELSEAGEYEAAARFEMVPSSAVGLALDWRKNELVVDRKRYVAARVRVADIVGLLDDSPQTWETATVERFGAFYRVRNSARPVGRRGRRKSLDWGALRAHLSLMEAKGELPANKESCIYELIAFSERELAKRVSRTSVQRNLAEDLARLYQ